MFFGGNNAITKWRSLGEMQPRGERRDEGHCETTRLVCPQSVLRLKGIEFLADHTFLNLEDCRFRLHHECAWSVSHLEPGPISRVMFAYQDTRLCSARIGCDVLPPLGLVAHGERCCECIISKRANRPPKCHLRKQA